jgi:hypothetical protein
VSYETTEVVLQQWFPTPDASAVVIPQLLAMLDPSNVINIRYLCVHAVPSRKLTLTV